MKFIKGSVIVLFCFLLKSSLLFCKPLSSEDLIALYDLEFAEEKGIVKRSFHIDVAGFQFPYNPSLLKRDNAQWLIFRYDPWSNKFGKIKSHLGLLQLDQNFKPIGKAKLLDMGYENPEDPRFFATEKEVFVSYSYVKSRAPFTVNIGVSQLDLQTEKIVEHATLGYKEAPIEKNWTPFIYKNKNMEEEVFFIYKYLPHRILKLSLPLDGSMEIAYDNKVGKQRLQKWQDKWGLIRGGTPAIRLENEYLSFFHSAFRYKKVLYYVFGAITFEAEPPFRIKKISKYPIFFKNLYATPVTTQSWFYPREHLRVVFPSGVAKGEEDGRSVFYVVYGENDVAIGCVVIDKECLLKSLVKV